ncbi:hypothetical protein ACQR3P_29485 [Rhodococcus sp. IEGM1300]
MGIQTTMEGMEIGDKIIARYQVDATGKVGRFSEIGTYPESSAKLSATPVDKPDGGFYFICVGEDIRGRKILVADRNIQGKISWDELNTAGIATHQGTLFKYDPVGKMTGYENESVKITDNGFESGTYGAYYGWRVFDGKNRDGDKWTKTLNESAELKIEFKKRKELINSLSVARPPVVSATDLQLPVHFQIWAGDSEDAWDLLFENTEAFTETVKEFSFENEKEYSLYKLIVLSSKSQIMQIGELKFGSQIKNYSSTLRLLTGGVTESSAVDSEWNRYLSDGVIAQSEWNFVMNASWSWTSTTPAGYSRDKVARGYNALNHWGKIGESIGSSWTEGAFRPALVVEALSLPKETRFLVKRESSIEVSSMNQTTGEREWITLAETVLTKKLFLTHGMTDLSSIPETAWAEIDGDFEILCFKEEASPLQVKVTTETLYDSENKRYAGTGSLKVDEIDLPIGASGFMIHALSEGTVFKVSRDGVELGEKQVGQLHPVDGDAKLELFAKMTNGSIDAVALLWV